MEDEIKILQENDDGTTVPPEEVLKILTELPTTTTPETQAEEL